MKPTARERAHDLRWRSDLSEYEIYRQILAAERAAAERMRERCALTAGPYHGGAACAIRALPLEEPDAD